MAKLFCCYFQAANTILICCRVAVGFPMISLLSECRVLGKRRNRLSSIVLVIRIHALMVRVA